MSQIGRMKAWGFVQNVMENQGKNRAIFITRKDKAKKLD